MAEYEWGVTGDECLSPTEGWRSTIRRCSSEANARRVLGAGRTRASQRPDQFRHPRLVRREVVRLPWQEA
jgi:hypothetical protein